MGKIRLLCTGDLHLGRTSSKCVHDGEDAAAYSVRKAWERIVGYAIDSSIDVLLLSGDIADSKSNQYEAMGPFEAGIRRLSRHGIDTFAVAGNHDALTLPRLSRVLSDARFYLLGAGGEWEQIGWPVGGSFPATVIAGRSFADRCKDRLPLDSFNPQCPDGVPLIAIAHTDYLFGGEVYAPVDVRSLQLKSGVDMWLLGHLHRPDMISGMPLIVNSGSPQALDPGETGIHGPWIAEIEDGRISDVRQVPLSNVEYRDVTVDIGGMDRDAELAALIMQSLDKPEDEGQSASGSRRLSCRISLAGRSSNLNAICRDADNMLSEQPFIPGHNIYIESISVSDIGPAYNLQQLCERPDIIGSLARMLSAVEDGREEESYGRLTSEIGNAMSEMLGAVTYRNIDRGLLPTAADILKSECRRAIDSLLGQEEERQ